MDGSPLPFILASAVLFGLVAFFTRAGPLRMAAALLGGVLAALLNVAWDFAGYRFGWWRYSAGAANHAPWALYTAVALWFGAGAGLIGWRIIRRFRASGAAFFFALYMVLGVARDLSYAHGTGVISFGAGFVPILMDMLGWLSLAAIVQLTMRMLAGPAGADPLRNRG